MIFVMFECLNEQECSHKVNSRLTKTAVKGGQNWSWVFDKHHTTRLVLLPSAY